MKDPYYNNDNWLLVLLVILYIRDTNLESQNMYVFRLEALAINPQSEPALLRTDGILK